ncbi:WD40 repeat-like protein [Auriculariales sp. MPI-PUGE-AT-0066]|nr:WD40 repeat-like protein [Auriculariales sp. MPI-PUGE-AT-0066]
MTRVLSPPVLLTSYSHDQCNDMSMPSMPLVKQLPYTTIQPDFVSVLRDVREGVVGQEDFWVSCYPPAATGGTGVHGKVRVTTESTESRDGITWHHDTGATYRVSCTALKIDQTRLQVPRASIQGDSPISAMDVYSTSSSTSSPNDPTSSRVVVAHEDGRVIIHDASPVTSTEKPKSFSIGRDVHAEAVVWFPSGSVLLVGTSTFEVRVVSAPRTITPDPPLGTTPRTLRGHRRAITDLALLDRGREVLSSAKDGTVRLWDVGQGEQTWMGVATGSAPVLSMTASASDTRTVWLALGDGALERLDIRSSTNVTPLRLEAPIDRPPAALHTVTISQDGSHIASGARDGVTTLRDIRSPTVPLARWARTGSCIEGLAFAPSSSVGTKRDLIVATEDGLPYRTRIGTDGEVAVEEEYVGAECDPVRAVRWTGSGIWTASADGVVRRY